MTEGEGILRRWSRRKREARTEPAALPPAAPAPVLPPIESLGSGSDYAAFLQAGVPPALQRLALARAWQSDAGIAGFRGMADYDWDFNAPGYGSLRGIDHVAKLVAAVMDMPAPETPPPVSDGGIVAAGIAVAAVKPEAPAEPETPAQVAAKPAPVIQRRHGTAMPC